MKFINVFFDKYLQKNIKENIMLKLKFLLITFISILLLNSCTSFSDNNNNNENKDIPIKSLNTSVIEGYINNNNNVPLEKVKVDVYNSSNNEVIQTIITDLTGYFKFSTLPSANYYLIATLEINSKILSTRIPNIQLGENNNINLKNIILTTTGIIIGKINLKDSSVNKDINIYISNSPYSAITDINGNFTLSNIAEGTYDLQIIILNIKNLH
jgi:hypothetical protein